MKDMYNLLRAGADKVSINSAAVRNPKLIEEGAQHFGSQCIVVAIDARKVAEGKWNVYVNGGRVDTGMDAIGGKARCYAWCRRNFVNEYGCRWNEKRI